MRNRINQMIIGITVLITHYSYSQTKTVSYDARLDYIQKYFVKIDTLAEDQYLTILSEIASDSTKIEYGGENLSCVELVLLRYGANRTISANQLHFLSFLIRQPNLPIRQYNPKGFQFYLTEDLIGLQNLIQQAQERQLDVTYLKCLELGLRISKFHFSQGREDFFNELEQFYVEYRNFLENGFKSMIPLNQIMIEIYDQSDLKFNKVALKFIRDHDWGRFQENNLIEFIIFIQRPESLNYKIIRDYRMLYLSM